MATITKIEKLFSNKAEHLIIKKTPETTNVAACINALTGVGPSIASGNQICNVICADLPKTPQNIKKLITVIALKSKQKKVKDFPITQGIKAKIVT